MATPHPSVLDLAVDERPDDADLMHRIQSGEHRALDEALSEYWEPLVRYASGFLGSSDAAEDAAQEAFVRLWKHRNKWSATESLRAYLYRILRNYILDERRAQRVRSRWRERALLRKPHGPMTPVEYLEHGELSDAVSTALADLPPRRREVFTLARFHGLSYAEIAEAMDVSPQTVANQMSAALSTLRERLAPFLAPPDRPHLWLVHEIRD